MDEKLIECVQDEQSMYSALLIILEAIETGVMPKSFLVFHDSDINDVMNTITSVMKSKYGIKVQE